MMTKVSKAGELISQLEKVDGIAEKENWSQEKQQQVKSHLIEDWKHSEFEEHQKSPLD